MQIGERKETKEKGQRKEMKENATQLFLLLRSKQYLAKASSQDNQGNQRQTWIEVHQGLYVLS